MQLTAGFTAFGALYYSLYQPSGAGKASKEPLVDPEVAKQVAAFERESQKTTAQVWGLPGPPTPHARRSPGETVQSSLSVNDSSRLSSVIVPVAVLEMCR